MKCALQVPELTGDWLASIGPECYSHPSYAAVLAAITAAGGPTPGLAGGRWADAVLAACADDSERALVRELAVEPPITTGEPSARYVTSILARLLSDEAGRRLAELKRTLGQLDPVRQAEQVSAVFADLMDLENYRRELARAGQEDL